MRQDVGGTLNLAFLDLVRSASIDSDQDAWAVFQQRMEETVLSWFQEHPGSEIVSRLKSEKHFLSFAFEQLRQAILQRQVDCEKLSEVLMFLRVSLNGAILETLRDYKRPGAISSIWLDGEDCTVRSELWDWLQTRLPNRREQRLAYLLYHCGLKPSEIVRFCPQEWSDTREITRLRCVILKRLVNESYC
jgi:hypothetical protein